MYLPDFDQQLLCYSSYQNFSVGIKRLHVTTVHNVMDSIVVWGLHERNG